MSLVTVEALQPFVDYKTGMHHEVGSVVTLDRTEFEILQALTAQVYVVVEDADKASEEEEDGEVSSNGADA